MLPIKDNIPTDRLPVVTLALIAVSVLVYFVLARGGIASGPTHASMLHFGAIPAEVTGREPDAGPVTAWATLVTALFLHGGVLHLAGEMLFLWWFGTSVEDAMSRPRFLAFYLLAGLCAIGLQVALDPGATAPALGASGAIAGVIGGYLALYPRARFVSIALVPLMFTLIELPAWILAGVWLLMQAGFAATSLAHPLGGSGSVAFLAQAGGLAFGLLAIRAFAQRRKRLPPPSAPRPAKAVLR